MEATVRTARLTHLKLVVWNAPWLFFDMKVFRETRCILFFCGTVHCAGGWAAEDPEFKRQGLRWTGSGKRIVCDEAPKTSSNFDALAAFFGLSDHQSGILFGRSGSRTVRKWEVVNNIDRLLEGKRLISYHDPQSKDKHFRSQ